jgi:hypothetical protein
MEYEVVAPASTGLKTALVYAVVVDQGQLYTDLMVIFPIRSSKGSWYTMVVYAFYCNCILAVIIDSRSSTEWLTTYGRVHQDLTARGSKPKVQTMENEASGALQSYLTENDIAYQLGPPHCHRHNAAE